MSKIIFLDFDGVITTLKSKWTIDNEKVELVKQICDATGAKIVISSSWRRYTLEQTIEAITTRETKIGHNPFPYPEYIIDITSRMYGFKYGNKETHYGLCRGVEIDRWLWEHQDVTNYVILDDDPDMLLSQKKHFIKTHALRGISKRDVKRAINILTKT
ncbi:HAD domain-containing protein [Bacteroides thetaiotaomicron]|jgi:hypothetical protein|uniref:HAD domain-containing protein n=1 Tax=Bacteroides TaxID=816 RepID=UPI00286E97CC|nr:HAD domain-containing protein [Bacteroides faecis]MCS2235553.1 HAD domain-containing protein [Bacteroides faecis]